MSRIKIKNFGPIKHGLKSSSDWINISKVTIFIGDQGSGKSTIAKLISTLTWIEKVLVRGDYNIEHFQRKDVFKKQYLSYHRLESYFIDGALGTEIYYEGLAFNIRYKNDHLEIEDKKSTAYPLPQIIYIPAERNFISYVKSSKELKLSSESMKEFISEFDEAKKQLKGGVSLPINDVSVEYDKLSDTVRLVGEGYKLEITDASSGFQSFTPLYLVSKKLAESVVISPNGNNTSPKNASTMSSEELSRFKDGVASIYSSNSLTEEQKRAALSVLSSKFNKTAFINVVEEPEQNLYPTSQWKMLLSLLKFNNLNDNNKLVLTTHSPYLINYISLTIKASNLKRSMDSMEDYASLNEIVPLESVVQSDTINIYQLSLDGSISLLDGFNGIPSDQNILNSELDDANGIFSDLLELQQTL